MAATVCPFTFNSIVTDASSRFHLFEVQCLGPSKRSYFAPYVHSITSKSSTIITSFSRFVWAGDIVRIGHIVTQCQAWRGSSNKFDEAQTIELKVNGQTVAAILDTGAKPSVVDTQTIQRLGFENLVVPPKIGL